jgi:hypothetical protein
VHYTNPAQQDMLLLTVAEVQARRRQDQLLYARWTQRQAVYAERDRKVRRFWLGFGASVGVAVVVALVVAGWLLYTAAGGAWVLLALLGVPALGVVVPVGHRCITTIQHWH